MLLATWWIAGCTPPGTGIVQRPAPEPQPHTSTTGPTTLTPPLPPDGSPVIQFVGARPKNVLMLSIDTTRRDHVSPYSQYGDFTPFLAGLMSEGVQLDDHQQCSDWTFASTSCTLTGRYHEDNGYIPELIPLELAEFPDGQQSLAVRLGEHNYYRILVSSNGWLGPKVNNAQGYDSVPTTTTGNATQLGTLGLDLLVAQIVAEPERPWLLHVHFVEPHPPYTPPVQYLGEELLLPPLPQGMDISSQPGQYDATGQYPNLDPEVQDLLEAHLRARYHGELKYLDDQLRSLWTVFDTTGILDDTLVVVWTDHGEQFWEHGDQSHAWYLAAEENDAILFYWAKNIVPLDWTEPTHAVDMLPTVLDALGYPAAEDDDTLNGYVLGTAPDGRPRFGMSVARGGVLESVTLDDWKLIYGFDGKLSLYDRKTDRYEVSDLYTADHPEVPHLWDLLLPRVLAVHELLPLRPLTWPADLPHPDATTRASE